MKNFFIYALIVIFTGCAGGAMQKEHSGDGIYGKAEIAGKDEVSAVQEKKRIILYNAYYRLECEDPDKTSKLISSLAQTFGGY